MEWPLAGLGSKGIHLIRRRKHKDLITVFTLEEPLVLKRRKQAIAR